MPPLHNVCASIPADVPEELVRTLAESEHVRIEQIVSRGHASPDGFWYDQPQHEFVLLLSGAARLRFAGEGAAIQLAPGDHLTIPPHCRHRVEWTTPDEPTVWLAVHYSAWTADTAGNDCGTSSMPTHDPDGCDS